MPASSTLDAPAIIVGLHPWNDFYYPPLYFGDTTLYSLVEADKIRIYRDRALTSSNDPDRDGLTTELESFIGLDPNSADTSKDGIMDGLAVYGSEQLPLPNLGVRADQKNVLVEVDSMTNKELTQKHLEAIQAAGYAFDEVDVNFIALTGEFATYTMESCGIKCQELVLGGFECNYVCDDIDVPVITPRNSTPIIPETEVLWWEMCDVSCLKQQASASFDLSKFPFIRRLAWVRNNLEDAEGNSVCGFGEVISTGIGRFAVVGCDGPTFTHEIGHLLGLRHGGRDDKRPFKPNYWSVMSYGVYLPLPEYAGYTFMAAKESGYTVEGYNLTSFRGVPNRFSKTTFIHLNENGLNEEAGLTGGHCLNSNCSNYSDPYTFESIREPLPPYENFIDITVGWLDWDGNGFLSSNSAIRNIDEQCKEDITTGVWTNENTNETGPTEAVCREMLEPRNDHAYFANIMDQSAWSSCGNLDLQRAELGLDPVTTCSVAIPPRDVISCN